nr:hypothetical protein [Nostoc sp. DedSLP05]MDZ8101998.1 hypothetical protein [Nostoc sp. DedSLP01]
MLGDREFHSIKLANWLQSKEIGFVLRQKQGTYIRHEKQPYQRLQSLGLNPGISLFLPEIQATKQKGFAKFNLVGYYKRKYRGKLESAGWFLLTNLDSLPDAVKAFKLRSGIEAMFKDCKSGGTALGGFADLKQVPCGYNLESSHATGQRLIALILLIAIAYTIAVLAGRKSRKMGLQQYIGRLQELKRYTRRHSTFWIRLYGYLWVAAMEFWSDLAIALVHLKPGKLPYFQQCLRAMTLIQSAL